MSISSCRSNCAILLISIRLIVRCRHLPSPSLSRCCLSVAELLQPDALIVKLSAMAEPKPDAVSIGSKNASSITEKKGLATLVKVESVCTGCGLVGTFHMPTPWIRRWLNDGDGSPECKCGGSWAPGRALYAYHNGKPCDLPARLKVGLESRLCQNSQWFLK